jgi:hypothetical protein
MGEIAACGVQGYLLIFVIGEWVKWDLQLDGLL